VPRSRSCHSPSPGGATVKVPETFGGQFGVMLFYRGSWCPCCNAQLRAFQRVSAALAGAGVQVAALSVDAEATTVGVIAKHGLTFPAGFGADPRDADLTGAFVNPDPVYLQSTGTRPLALYKSGFAPRWYVPRANIDESALTPAEGQTFYPRKGLRSYYDIAGAHQAAWSYQDAWAEVRRISGLVSFEPDKAEVRLDGTWLRLEPGQAVIPYGSDHDLTTGEMHPREQR